MNLYAEMNRLEGRARELVQNIKSGDAHHQICSTLATEYNLLHRDQFPIWLSRVVTGIMEDEAMGETPTPVAIERDPAYDGPMGIFTDYEGPDKPLKLDGPMREIPISVSGRVPGVGKSAMIPDTGDGDEVIIYLEDSTDQTRTIRTVIKIGRLGVSFIFDGYGDCNSTEGHGTPIFVEYYEGQPKVYIWSDINQEDPTHAISLAGAMESTRQE